jgi:Protein of unknown function (DUF2946)
MDETVRRALARWPDVPAVVGWLALDRRGEWRLRNPSSGAFERIGNAALRDFIARNYAADARGAWYFQNGPQRVYARLESTPLVYRCAPGGFRDHCGRGAGTIRGAWVDEQGALYLAGVRGGGVIDDRDLQTVSMLLENRHGDALDAEFDWAALAPGDAWLRLGGRARIAVGRLARGALEKQFGFLSDPPA